MTASRLLLALVALAFAGVGAAYAIAPVEMARVSEIRVASPSARADIRAQYGGFQIGFAGFLFYCLAGRDRTALGLLASALTLGGFAAARGTSLLTDGPGNPVLYAALSLEAVGAVLSAVGWWASCRVEAPPPTEDW